MNFNKWKEPAVHISLIFLFISIPVLSSPDFHYSLDLFRVEPFKRSLLGYLLLIIFFYSNYYLLIPKFFDTKKYAFYAVSVAVAFVLLSLISNSVFDDRPPRPFPQEAFPRRMPLELPQVLNLLVPFTIVFLFSLVLFLNRKKKQIELDKIQIELENLRYQLQPHFLFNSLNNIYALAMIEPEKTAGYILELSEIFRYLLQTDRSKSITVSEDVRFCRQYTDLQILRFGKHDNWKIDLAEEQRQEEIAPFILIPFIENVFKYGVHPEKSSPLEITIGFRDSKLLLHTYNLKNNDGSGSLMEANKIGLQKTKERLTLLFPGKHAIEISETAEDFTVDLILDLK